MRRHQHEESTWSESTCKQSFNTVAAQADRQSVLLDADRQGVLPDVALVGLPDRYHVASRPRAIRREMLLAVAAALAAAALVEMLAPREGDRSVAPLVQQKQLLQPLLLDGAAPATNTHR